MFNFIGKNNRGINVIDQVFVNSAAKWNYVIDLWSKDHDMTFVFWFDDTVRQAEEFIAIQAPGKFNLATTREVRQYRQPANSIIFCEHYPLKDPEQETFHHLQLQEVTVLSALDEPFFKKFGSEKIIRLMTQMGMNEKDALQHRLITKAIQNAQQKIKSSVVVEQSALSQSSWLQNNLAKW
jgi:hypothetical protein